MLVIEGGFRTKIIFAIVALLSFALLVFELATYYNNIMYTEISTEEYSEYKIPLQFRMTHDIVGVDFSTEFVDATLVGPTKTRVFKNQEDFFLGLIIGDDTEDGETMKFSIQDASEQEMTIVPEGDVDISKGFAILIYLNDGFVIDTSLILTAGTIHTTSIRAAIENKNGDFIDEFYFPLTFEFGKGVQVVLSPFEERENGRVTLHGLTTAIQGMTELARDVVSIQDTNGDTRISCIATTQNCMHVMLFQPKQDNLKQIIDHKTRTAGELIGFFGAAWASAALLMSLFFRDVKDSKGVTFTMRQVKEIWRNVVGMGATKAGEEIKAQVVVV